ncbi:RNA-binding domain-containing protein, partial [Imleria badia]
MSDAQAALVTENGVPPATQDYLIEEAPGFKVFAGNLAYSTTDEGLKTFFAPVQSDIISVQVILRGSRSAGYGFVAVSSAEAAQKAVESLNGQELEGRSVIIEIAKPAEQKDQEKKEKKSKRRPGRRGAKAVPGEVTEAEADGDVKADDAPAAPGTDEAAKPKKKKKKTARKPKRKAAVPAEGEVPQDAQDAPLTEDAAEAPPPRKLPRARKPRAQRSPRPAGEDPVGEPSKTTLFVANLGFNIDDDGLSALFTDAGINVISARVVRRKFGRPRRSKGYGFVDVGSEEEQKKAIEAIEGKEVGGRPIAVKIAREEESRQEGLHRSLFERAKQDTEGENKALGIMLKMGFKIGQSLGQKEGSPAQEHAPSGDDAKESSEPTEQRNMSSDSSHRAEPLPLNEWAGKKGIGLGKRTRSPGASDRLAKMAKMAEDATKESFRDFTRREYEERRAEARLAFAQRTCTTLDEEAGITFNVLWLNPHEADSIPKGLTDALLEYTQGVPLVPSGRGNEATRLRDQMRADALQPVPGDDDENTSNDHRARNKEAQQEEFPADTVEEVAFFFRLGPRDRLSLVLTYLRDKYAYCFWCGTKYEDDGDLEKHCPGPNEDDHD